MLTEGSRRADELAEGRHPWTTARGAVMRGYRSAVDGSVQPYCVWVPENYDPSRPGRLDVVLHGRNRVLTEVSFLSSAKDNRIVTTEAGRKPAPDCLKLYVFGRGNNSYRWAGESDVFEALASCRSRYTVDPQQLVLRGFSMGGTGAWHLGLHFPSRWAAVEAGAGFVETRPEVRREVRDPWCMASLAIHDASNCALNMGAVPFVAYVGTRDPQREQNDIIRRNLSTLGIDPDAMPRVRFLLGDGTGHNFRPDSKRQADELIASWLPQKLPDQFAFAAYTPAYGAFGDIVIDTLEQLYQRAEIRGTRDELQTVNVLALRLAQPRAMVLDGQRLAGADFHKVGDRWQAGLPEGLRKHAGLQGPIDDAFQQPFLCVAPEGGPDSMLEQFRQDFSRYLRGDIRIKRPPEVTPDDISSYNLILFGDPGTNSWIQKILPGLPLQWSRGELRLHGRIFSSEKCTVAMIYPNPLNPSRYVVLNSGHTFPGSGFQDMHWWLHPRLGDFAVLDKQTRQVLMAGYFDASWRFGAELWPSEGIPFK